MVSLTDHEYLQIALELAAQGASLVSPNPLVGSLVVKDGEIVGRGYHRFLDIKHAEVWALEEAGPRTEGATVYVNLEPCCHQGDGKRTPPCVQALLDAKVARVVASIVDPNPKVNGRGFAALREAGVEVVAGGFEREATRLNEKYIKLVKSGRPFVHLKLACSIDGRIATRTGEAKWITGEEARAASQSLRHEYDAIAVGVNTVLADDPLMTDRTGLPRHRPLLRVIFDSGLRTPAESQLLITANAENPVLIFCGSANAARFKQPSVEVVPMADHDGKVDLGRALAELGRRRITGLIVEGGSEIAAALLYRKLVDKVTFFFAPKIIGGRDAFPAIGGRGIDRLSEAIGLTETEIIRRGDDWEVTGYPVYAS